MTENTLQTKINFEWRAVDELIPYAGNARKHPERQIEKIMASISEVGFLVPILVDGAGIVVAGHGRLEAAKRLSMASVPTVRAAHLTESQRRLYTIADNRIAEDAKWDDEKLAKEMAELFAEGADLSLTGFAEVDVNRLLDEAEGKVPARGQTDPDAAPGLPEAAVALAGDCWLLGAHRLVCGDSTNADDVARALGSSKPNLMVTDPPYGVNYDPNWRNEAARTSPGMGNRALGAGAVGKVRNDDRADWRAAWMLFPGNVAYVWHGGLHDLVVAQSLEAAGYRKRSQIIWVKTRPVISRGAYHWQHEPAFFAVREGEPDDWRFVPEHECASYAVLEKKPADWHGGRRQSTTWFIETPKNDTGHGTQKPVECMRRPIINNSSRGDAVYEPFSGSGTTIIAGEITERRIRALELNPLYVDVAIARWQDFTGREAVLEGDGRTFAMVAAQRGRHLVAA